jgi:hypothetical protein
MEPWDSCEVFQESNMSVPNRAIASHFTWGWKQIQFPKRCVLQFLEYQMMDQVQKPSNTECYMPLSEPCRIK